jgi:hypothetical protein
MVAFLKEAYCRAKFADKFLMSQQPKKLKVAAGIEVPVEHAGGLVFLGHAPERCMWSNGHVF